MPSIRMIIGIDPGLRHTGWGIVAQENNRLSFIAAGRISPDTDIAMAARLCQLAEELSTVVSKHQLTEAAIEESFMHKNAASALKLGQARGAAMLTLAQAGLDVAEYAANRIKQSVVGYGHADKTQVQDMINLLLPGSGRMAADAADALAVAITHAHHADMAALKVRA